MQFSPPEHISIKNDPPAPPPFYIACTHARAHTYVHAHVQQFIYLANSLISAVTWSVAPVQRLAEQPYYTCKTIYCRTEGSLGDIIFKKM